VVFLNLRKKHWIFLAIVFVIACGIVIGYKILLDRQQARVIMQFREALLPGSAQVDNDINKK
jgi:hypothetical protein